METTTAPDRPLLADVEHLAALLRVPDSHPGVQVALQLASDRFRGESRRSITAVTNDEVVLDGDGSRVLLLPDAPIRQLHTVEVDGRDVTGEVEHSPANGLLRRATCWPDRLGAIKVVYDHGYAEVPGDVVAAVIGLARVIFITVPGLSSMTIGSQSTVFTSAAAGLSGGVTETWTAAVANYRLRGDRP